MRRRRSDTYAADGCRTVMSATPWSNQALAAANSTAENQMYFDDSSCTLLDQF